MLTRRNVKNPGPQNYPWIFKWVIHYSAPVLWMPSSWWPNSPTKVTPLERWGHGCRALLRAHLGMKPGISSLHKASLMGDESALGTWGPTSWIKSRKKGTLWQVFELPTPRDNLRMICNWPEWNFVLTFSLEAGSNDWKSECLVWEVATN